METIIVANGKFKATPPILERLDRAGLIVAADGGAIHLHRLGRCPGAVIGDLDSITQEARRFFEQKKVPFICHPPEKDQTDMELCLTWALDQGASDITFLGATGRRLDHTLGNIFLLKCLDKMNIPGRILDENNEITLTSRPLELSGRPDEILSLVPASERVTGITLQGFAYPLDNDTLTLGSARGVSNRFLGGEAAIHMESGTLLVIRSRD